MRFLMHRSLVVPVGLVNVGVDFSTVVELLLWTGVNSDGHLKTDLVTCKVGSESFGFMQRET